MPGSDGLRILGDFWKKAVSWDLNLDEASWFSNLDEASPVGSTRCAARGGVRWNRQHCKNCVSLSSCWKPKSQEGNKSFVPELPEVVSVSSVFRFPMHVNVLHIRIVYVSVYFTYSYYSYLAMLQKENSEFKTIKLCFKIDLVSPPVCEGFSIYAERIILHIKSTYCVHTNLYIKLVQFIFLSAL